MAKSAKKGFLNPLVVRRASFWISAVCLAIAVVASILAIWEFTGTDTLWRTVATCLVIGTGTVLFAWLNGLFALDDE